MAVQTKGERGPCVGISGCEASPEEGEREDEDGTGEVEQVTEGQADHQSGDAG